MNDINQIRPIGDPVSSDQTSQLIDLLYQESGGSFPVAPNGGRTTIILPAITVRPSRQLTQEYQVEEEEKKEQEQEQEENPEPKQEEQIKNELGPLYIEFIMDSQPKISKVRRRGPIHYEEEYNYAFTYYSYHFPSTQQTFQKPTSQDPLNHPHQMSLLQQSNIRTIPYHPEATRPSNTISKEEEESKTGRQTGGEQKGEKTQNYPDLNHQ